MTLSEEDYLKAIYHLGKGTEATVSTNAIAEKIRTKPSSVTDMIKKLSDKGLVDYRRYKGVSLTDPGKTLALTVIRKHRLWEVFMVEKLGFAWNEVHEVAEQLEHIKSEQLIEKLDHYLGFPRVDPHGDPIPTKEGEFKALVKKLLSEVTVGTEGVCIGVKDSSESFLNFLDKNQIALGEKIKVLDKEEFDGSLHIKIKERRMQISRQIAGNLFIELP
ncbi:MAG TPA: metal-dependent transcriptional regulator [Pricia sp.]|nr:metal-dependent transcriptional regulator [Pricia sp.]